MKILPQVLLVAVALMLAGCSGRSKMDEPMDTSMAQPVTGMESSQQQPMGAMDSMSGATSAEAMMMPQSQSMDAAMP